MPWAGLVPCDEVLEQGGAAGATSRSSPERFASGVERAPCRGVGAAQEGAGARGRRRRREKELAVTRRYSTSPGWSGCRAVEVELRLEVLEQWVAAGGPVKGRDATCRPRGVVGAVQLRWSCAWRCWSSGAPPAAPSRVVSERSGAGSSVGAGAVVERWVRCQVGAGVWERVGSRRSGCRGGRCGRGGDRREAGTEVVMAEASLQGRRVHGAEREGS